MEVTASAKSLRISTRKVRLVADSIRKMSVKKALATLSLVEKRSASSLTKILKSAIANAVNNAKLVEDNLIIDQLIVTEGPFLKRFHASTRGRIHPYKKRSSHIRIVLKEKGAK
ncbi:MAG TPA: 50S ribosomal protein L22 [Candidatus Saccharimonadales bacterium]|nr:50S ribosomal protein L22 [Candidatus Saccharimonadales bacterium]